jgi:predicted acetyltransferase
MFPAKGEHGEREQELMARWFADETSHPLLILKNDKPAGFALVSRPPRHQRQEVDFRMADFFITPRSRRLGIGRDAAALIFNRFAGTWEIVEFVYNKPAVSFWRAIVGGYTGGKFKERVSQGEVHQVLCREGEGRKIRVRLEPDIFYPAATFFRCGFACFSSTGRRYFPV